MAGIHALDRLIGNDYPELLTDEEVRAFEQVPYADRIAAESTYDAIKLGSRATPTRRRSSFCPMPILPTRRSWSRTATSSRASRRPPTCFMRSAREKGDVISFMLPLLPDAFVTLFGAEAAGIANPVNPLLEPHQIAEILEAAKTTILVALGPMPGTDIWQKVEQIRPQLKHLKAIVQVAGGGDPANGIFPFNDLIKQQPSDRLVSGRKISGSDIAAYFHTGGTTGTPKLVRHTHTNQVYQAWALNLLLKTKPGANMLFGMPLFHVGGSLTQVLLTLSAGGCAGRAVAERAGATRMR